MQACADTFHEAKSSHFVTAPVDWFHSSGLGPEMWSLRDLQHAQDQTGLFLGEGFHRAYRAVASMVRPYSKG